MPATIDAFLQPADFRRLAHALAGNHVVVTHEVAANSPGCIKTGRRLGMPRQGRARARRR